MLPTIYVCPTGHPSIFPHFQKCTPTGNLGYQLVKHQLYIDPNLQRNILVKDFRKKHPLSWTVPLSQAMGAKILERLEKITGHIAVCRRGALWWFQHVFLIFHPRKLGKIPILTNNFQTCWNHHLVVHYGVVFWRVTGSFRWLGDWPRIFGHFFWVPRCW